MARKHRIIIVGATSAIAEHCARAWVTEGKADLVLVGRNQRRLERLADDLRARDPNADVSTYVVENFQEPEAIRAAVEDIAARGGIDIALVAHGDLPDQETCQTDLVACRDALMINGISPILFAEALAGQMERKGRGTLAIIGSVAGDRGRRSNYIYGAAKGALTRHAQGMRHRFAQGPVSVVLIKPGPTDTPMTTALKQRGTSLASVEDVAQRIVRGIQAGKGVVYAPPKWALIMLIIRHLPWFLFKRLDI
jgi:decaprenylphospho-beta-D-erythro-pentofuranosid-2-ulose 2-reductase